MTTDHLSRRRVLATLSAGAAAAAIPACAPANTQDRNLGHGPGVDGPADGWGDGSAADGDVDAGLDGAMDAALPTVECAETVENVLGPYYRSGAPLRNVIASPGDGQWLVINGSVRSAGDERTPSCGILAGALLDIWQANADADYDMVSASYPWRGKFYSDANGAFSFETIIPGAYLNGSQYRPRHIHLRASYAGYRLLTTQIYFKGDPYLAADPFMHPSLAIQLTKQNGAWHGTFPVVLARE